MHAPRRLDQPTSSAASAPRCAQFGTLTSEAFDLLYRASWPAIVDYLRFRIGPAEGVDVAADVFVRAWKARAQYEPARGAPEAWLWGIARNGAKDWLRRRGEHQDPLDRNLAMDTGLAEHGEQAEAMAHVAKAVAQLDPIDQDIVALRFGGGLSHRDIGATLGITEAGAATRLHRAVKRLRQIVEGRSSS